MPQRQVKTYTGGTTEWVPDEFGNIAFDYNKVGSGEGGARWGTKSHYQALNPEIALNNYALKFAPRANNEAYLVQNITNPDTYYDLDLSLREQPRFIRNIIANSQYYTDINQGALGKILDNSQIERVIEENVDKFYNKYAKFNTYPSDWIKNKEEARQILKDNLYGTNYNPKSYTYRSAVNRDIRPYVGTDNFNKAYEFFENQGIDPTSIDYNTFDKKVKEFELEKILQENQGEIPQRLLKDKKLERILDVANREYTLSPEDSNYLGNIIKRGGGSGISPTSFQDDKIYVAKNPQYTTSLPVNSKNAEEVADAMVDYKRRDPFWDMQKENLKVQPIKQIKTGSFSELSKNINKKTNTNKPTTRTPELYRIKNISNVQPKVEYPVVPIKQIPKQVEVPLGARLYEAGLNPTKVAKVLSDPKLLSQASKALGQIVTNPKTYTNLAKGIFTPENIAMIGSDYLIHKADQAVENRLKAKYNVKSQAEFNKLYPSLSTIERGQLGQTYPEMYQTYMKGR